jgi:hypothetical protein
MFLPAFAMLAWGLVLYHVYRVLPGQRAILAELGVRLPEVSEWVLANAFWWTPTLGILSALVTGVIRRATPRWLLFGGIAILTLLGVRLIEWFALLRVVAGDLPRGL